MATTSTVSKNPTPSTNNVKPVEPIKAPDATSTAPSAPVEAPKTEVQADNTASPKVIISISVEPKLARQARLLARFNGVSISSLFTDAAAASIPIALKAALSDLKDEVE
jgi:hypothetical protein